jgi:hypothetical protein
MVGCVPHICGAEPSPRRRTSLRGSVRSPACDDRESPLGLAVGARLCSRSPMVSLRVSVHDGSGRNPGARPRCDQIRLGTARVTGVAHGWRPRARVRTPERLATGGGTSEMSLVEREAGSGAREPGRPRARDCDMARLWLDGDRAPDMVAHAAVPRDRRALLPGPCRHHGLAAVARTSRSLVKDSHSHTLVRGIHQPDQRTARSLPMAT